MTIPDLWFASAVTLFPFVGMGLTYVFDELLRWSLTAQDRLAAKALEEQRRGTHRALSAGGESSSAAVPR